MRFRKTISQAPSPLGIGHDQELNDYTRNQEKKVSYNGLREGACVSIIIHDAETDDKLADTAPTDQGVSHQKIPNGNQPPESATKQQADRGHEKPIVQKGDHPPRGKLWGKDLLACNIQVDPHLLP